MMSSIDADEHSGQKKGKSNKPQLKPKQGKNQYSDVSKSIVEYGFTTNKTKSSRERGNDSTDYHNDATTMKDNSRVYLINEPNGDEDRQKKL